MAFGGLGPRDKFKALIAVFHNYLLNKRVMIGERRC